MTVTPIVETTEREKRPQAGPLRRQVLLLPLLGGTTSVKLEIDLPMSEKAWGQMIAALNVLKSGIVADVENETGLQPTKSSICLNAKEPTPGAAWVCHSRRIAASQRIEYL